MYVDKVTLVTKRNNSPQTTTTRVTKIIARTEGSQHSKI